MQFVNVKSRRSRSFRRSLQRLGITCQRKMSWWTATELKLIVCKVLRSLKLSISLSQERKLNVESFCYTSASFAFSVCICLHVISCVNVSPVCSIPQVCNPHRLLNPSGSHGCHMRYYHRALRNSCACLCLTMIKNTTYFTLCLYESLIRHESYLRTSNF
jgi:hypothetical protein